MKTAGVSILILSLIVLLFRCVKEYSCEDCIEGNGDSTKLPPLQHPIKIPKDTVYGNIPYNELISYYDFTLENGLIKKIYFCVMTKYHPGHYYITDSIPIQSSNVSHYNGSFNLKNYLDMTKYVKNDTFPVFYQIRYKSALTVETDSATLKL